MNPMTQAVWLALMMLVLLLVVMAVLFGLPVDSASRVLR